MTWSPTELRQNIKAVTIGSEQVRETLLLMVDALEEERDHRQLAVLETQLLMKRIAALEDTRSADATLVPVATTMPLAHQTTAGPYRVSPLDGRTILAHGEEAIAVVSQRHNVTPGNAALLAASWDLYLALSGFVQDVQAREDWQDQVGVLVSGDHWARAVATLNRLRGLEG